LGERVYAHKPWFRIRRLIGKEIAKTALSKRRVTESVTTVNKVREQRRELTVTVFLVLKNYVDSLGIERLRLSNELSPDSSVWFQMCSPSVPA
jgi:hypothetical protein